jgi:hypothetical protein
MVKQVDWKKHSIKGKHDDVFKEEHESSNLLFLFLYDILILINDIYRRHIFTFFLFSV